MSFLIKKTLVSSQRTKMLRTLQRNSFSKSSVQYALDVSTKNGVKSIVLSDPKTRNSLSLNMIMALKEEMNKFDPDVRCIVLSAVGKVFSAGHNLKELMQKEGAEYHQKVFNECSTLMLGIQKLPVPVIGQLNGVAAAAGCQLIASCDIVIATDTSTFMTPGANVGIFCSTPGIPLVRNASSKVAAEMLLTGLPITAHKALQAGLVSAVVPENKLEEETDKRVQAILSKSRSVIALGKKFMYQQMEMSIEDAYRHGGKLMVKNINMKDGIEGIKSFTEKRKPTWCHEDN